MKRLLAAIVAVFFILGTGICIAEAEYTAEDVWAEMVEFHNIYMGVIVDGSGNGSAADMFKINSSIPDPDTGAVFSYTEWGGVIFAMLPEGDGVKNIALLSADKEVEGLQLHWLCIVCTELFALPEDVYMDITEQLGTELEYAYELSENGENYRSEFIYISENTYFEVVGSADYLSIGIYYNDPVDMMDFYAMITNVYSGN